MSAATASVYGWWGIVQNFFMGWYAEHMLGNLLLTLAFLAPMLILVLLTVSAIRFPDTAFLLHAIAAVSILAWLSYEFWTAGYRIDHRLITAVVLVVLGIAHWVGRPYPRRRAYLIVALVPLGITVSTRIAPAIEAVC